MGRRKREHKLAVIAGKEAPFRNPSEKSAEEKFAMRKSKKRGER